MDDPLGPLGAPTPPAAPVAEGPPAPPQKEPAGRAPRQTPGASTASLSGMMDSVNLDDDENENPVARGPRVPPPVQPPTAAAPQRQTQPSVSVEQAAKPIFTIYVGDPHKVGDLTSSHTEYSVMTKVLIDVLGTCDDTLTIVASRLHRKATAILNLPFPAATATSYGYTISYTTTTPASSFLRLQRSRLSDVLMLILWSRDALRWSEC